MESEADFRLQCSAVCARLGKPWMGGTRYKDKVIEITMDVGGLGLQVSILGEPCVQVLPSGEVTLHTQKWRTVQRYAYGLLDVTELPAMRGTADSGPIS